MTLQASERIAVPAAGHRLVKAQRPRINSPKVFGVRPGSPVLYRIAATGRRPMAFAAEGLPDGLSLDPTTGQFSGVLHEPGTREVRLFAWNACGTAQASLRIVVGPRIALTPPLGWNSWNCWGPKVDQHKILAAARAMVASGLADHGWSYINIDDGWQGHRDGALLPNEKFPDMQSLCDSIHAMGLKVGIYSTPWTRSFAGYPGGTSGAPHGPVRQLDNGWYIGAQAHDQADARQWAQWGIDYLKFDWGPMDLPSGRRMREALLGCGRDIVFNPTNSAPEADWQAWTELAEAYFLWRRPSQGDCDINDSWKSISSIGFRMHTWSQHVQPGCWNDPDMLVLGKVGWGKELRTCRLSRDEQYTHMSLWCLLAAPLLLGCDLTQLDEFTLSLLTNDEVLEVNQDPLGQAARRVLVRDETEVWSKPLEDGSLAVGLFNRGETPVAIDVPWKALELDGHWLVRDLWEQKEIGASADHFEASVNPHGVVLVRVHRT